MKKSKEIYVEPAMYGVIAALVAAVILSVISSILIYKEVIPENNITAIIISLLSGFASGLTSGKRAGKGPLPMAILSAVMYLGLALLFGQILFDGFSGNLYRIILGVMLGAIVGGIISANQTGKRKRKIRRA